MKPLRDLARDEFGGVPLNAVALAASVFGASLVGLGLLSREVSAQTATQTAAAAAITTVAVPPEALRMTTAARAEVEGALRAMGDADLALTYARIFATFRDYIGRDDLTVARALVDYAALAETEMTRRGLERPSGTDSARAMLVTYELVL